MSNLELLVPKVVEQNAISLQIKLLQPIWFYLVSFHGQPSPHLFEVEIVVEERKMSILKCCENCIVKKSKVWMQIDLVCEWSWGWEKGKNNASIYIYIYLVESICVLNIWLDLFGWPWSYDDFNL